MSASECVCCAHGLTAVSYDECVCVISDLRVELRIHTDEGSRLSGGAIRQLTQKGKRERQHREERRRAEERVSGSEGGRGRVESELSQSSMVGCRIAAPLIYCLLSSMLLSAVLPCCSAPLLLFLRFLLY